MWPLWSNIISLQQAHLNRDAEIRSFENRLGWSGQWGSCFLVNRFWWSSVLHRCDVQYPPVKLTCEGASENDATISTKSNSRKVGVIETKPSDYSHIVSFISSIESSIIILSFSVSVFLYSSSGWSGSLMAAYIFNRNSHCVVMLLELKKLWNVSMQAGTNGRHFFRTLNLRAKKSEERKHFMSVSKAQHSNSLVQLLKPQQR